MSAWQQYFNAIKVILRNEPLEDGSLVSTKGFVGYCHCHRITNRIYPFLKDYLDNEGLALFKKSVMRATKAGLSRAHQLKQVVEVLSQHKIPMLLFKGPSLSQRIYGSFVAKESRDLDVLIPTADISRAEVALNGIGFYREKHLRHLSSKSNKTYQKIFKDISFVHQETGLHLELHWELNSYTFLKNDSIWKVAVASDYFGFPVMQLNTMDYFIYLCQHGTHSLWKRWTWVFDVKDYYLRFQQQLPADLLVKRAREVGALSALQATNTMLKNFVGINFLNQSADIKSYYFLVLAKKELSCVKDGSGKIIASILMRARQASYRAVLYPFEMQFFQRLLFKGRCFFCKN
jgi:hypothetical protein